MPVFKVSVSRTGYGYSTFEVEAKDSTEAKEKALEEAGDHDYSEHSSEYNVEGITEG